MSDKGEAVRRVVQQSIESALALGDPYLIIQALCEAEGVFPMPLPPEDYSIVDTAIDVATICNDGDTLAILGMLRNLALGYLRADQPGKAERLLSFLLDKATPIFGSEHGRVGELQADLGRALLKRYHVEPDDAALGARGEKALRSAIENFERLSAHAALAHTTSDLAELLCQQNRFEEGVARYEQSLILAERAWGPGAHIARHALKVANALLDGKNYLDRPLVDAEPYLRQAIASLESAGDPHGQLQYCHAFLARVQESQT